MNRTTRYRVALLIVVATLVASGVLVRLVRLQIVQAHELQVRAEDQHVRQGRIEGRRGAIVDRNGEVLAMSIQTGSLWVRPGEVRDTERAVRQLSPILGMSAERIRGAITRDARRLYVKRGLDLEELEALRGLDLLRDEESGFGLDSENNRYYPGGSLAAHVVGFAGVDQRGLSGIEKHSHDQLQGEPSFQLEERDALGRRFVRTVRPPAKTHHDVVLTLDRVLQHVVERELERGMRESGARAAWSVMLDPASGEVLAMASRPTPELNEYSRSSTDQQRNLALQPYEPGSTFKIISAAAVLDRDVVRPDRWFDCENGRYRVGNKTYTDHEPFGSMTFAQIVERSSNIGMIKVASHLDGPTLLGYAERFGFGAATGIELPESEGTLPDLARGPKVARASLAIGYGISVTAVQLAAAIGAVANDGVLVEPRVVLGTRVPDGAWIPEESTGSRRVISARSAETLTRFMEATVLRGTGTEAAVPGYRVAGKTGTSRRHVEDLGYGKGLYYASFGGFAPSRDPRLVLLVVFDSPRGDRYYGGQIAAPVFARIMAASLAHLRVPPDDARRLVVYRQESGGSRGSAGAVAAAAGAYR
jgi:cell division protein FtsI (penicillin-binding protein 3)